MKRVIRKVEDILPEGWEEAARSEGAITRSGRSVKTAGDLLKLIFLCLEEKGSYGQAAAVLQLTGEMNITKNAVYERFIKSEKWLKWMCEHICLENRYLTEAPEQLKDYRVLLVDASNASKPGSDKADVRLHYLMELFSFNMAEMHVTGGDVGESMTRYSTLREKDLVIGDRAYGTQRGIRYVTETCHADYMLRMKAESFRLFEKTEDGYRIFDLKEQLKKWYAGRIVDLSLYCKGSDGEMLPLRICALGKDSKDIEKSTHQTKRSNNGKSRGKVTELQEIYNRFVVIATSLPAKITAEQIFSLYRMRWQIELFFKQMKTIFSLDESKARSDAAIRTWFYGKLLNVMLCEILLQRGRFSPEAYFPEGG